MRTERSLGVLGGSLLLAGAASFVVEVPIAVTLLLIFLGVGTLAVAVVAHRKLNPLVDKQERDSTDKEQRVIEDKEAESEITRRYKLKSLLSGKNVIEEDDLDEAVENLRLTLVENDVSVEVAEDICERVTSSLRGDQQRLGSNYTDVFRSAVEEAIAEILDSKEEDLISSVRDSEKPYVILFLGVNGVGKTTTIAKLSELFQSEGFSTVMANGDTFRAGAHEQIEEHAQNTGTKLIAREDSGDPTAVLYDAVEYAEANDVDVVLADTSGRLPTNQNLMNQVEKINRVIEPDEVIFVDEAIAGQDVPGRAKEFDALAPVTGIILTKADASEDSGVMLSLPYSVDAPVYYLGTGQDYDSLASFDSQEIAAKLTQSERV